MVRKTRIVGIITTVVIIIALILEVYSFYSFNKYENGFLEVYATEQDGYVKVTLDQINRLGERADEQTITDIIASLDASSSKYWMLSTESNILFIKSVTETNRYKNYNSESYYSSVTAKKFITEMSENKVTHALIELDDGRYIASGGMFTWNGQTYRICMLTLDKAILDQNEVLEPKHVIIIHLSVTLALFMVAIILSTNIIAAKNKKIAEDKDRMVQLNATIDHLDQLYKRETSYDANNHIFAMTVLPEFLEKLDRKDVRPIMFVYFEFDLPAIKEEFLVDMSVILDRDVIRFDAAGNGVLLLLTGYSEERCKKMIREADKWYLSLKKWLFVEDNMIPYTERFSEFWTGGRNEQYTII